MKLDHRASLEMIPVWSADGRWSFFAGWFSACLVHRGQKIAVPLALIFTNSPKMNVTVHGFSQAIIMIFAMPWLSPYVSSTDRLRFVLFNLWIMILCLIILMLGLTFIRLARKSDHEGWINSTLGTDLGIALAMTTSIISYLAFMLFWVAVRRDWPIQISFSRIDLTWLNSQLEMFELIADIVVGTIATLLFYIPQFFEMKETTIIRYNAICGYSVLGLSIIALFFTMTQFAKTANVYSEQIGRTTEELVEVEKLAAGSTASINRIRNWHVNWLPHICAPFWNHFICTPYYSVLYICSSLVALIIFPITLLHFDPINPGNGLLANWMITKEIPVYWITGVKTATALLGAFAVTTLPKLYCILRKETWLTAGFFGVGTAMLFLAHYLAASLSPVGERPLSSPVLLALVCAIVMARILFYMFNVASNGLVQVYVPPEYRGLLNGFMVTGTNLVRVIYMSLGSFLPFVTLVYTAKYLYVIGTISVIIFAAVPFKVMFGRHGLSGTSDDSTPPSHALSDKEIHRDNEIRRSLSSGCPDNRILHNRKMEKPHPSCHPSEPLSRPLLSRDQIAV